MESLDSNDLHSHSVLLSSITKMSVSQMKETFSPLLPSKGWKSLKKDDLISYIRKQLTSQTNSKDNDEELSDTEDNQTSSELLSLSSEPLPTSIEPNHFYLGDNLDLLKLVKSESVDMVYLDPPYNTGRDFHYFKDKFSDFNSFIEARLIECHRVLKPEGNIIVHVEPRISHHVRIILDKVFGESLFANEIVWHTGGNAKNKHQLGRNHDVLIVYGKSSSSKFFPLYKPYPEEYMAGAKMCPYHNKLYKTSPAHNSQPEVNPRLNLRYNWPKNGIADEEEIVKQWYFSKEKMMELHLDNRLEYNSNGIPRIKRFMEEMEGIPIRDTWDDISNIQSKEKTCYATQKPVSLLLRVLSLYSQEGDLCLDPFAGSGTLGRACLNLKRNYLLFDVNPEAKAVFLESIKNLGKTE